MCKSIFYQFILSSLLSCSAMLFLNPALAQLPAWAVNPADFSNSMSIIAQVQLDGSEENSNGNVLAAFVGSEVRGIASPTVLNGKAYYFLTVHSNAVQGETVGFQVFLSGAYSTFQALENIQFLKNSQLGTYPDGFKINISLSNDFPIAILNVPNDTTLMGIAFDEIALEGYLQTQDSDPVEWSVNAGANLIGTIDGSNMLQATPVNPTWTGTDSLLIIATETGTPNSFSAAQWVRLTVEENYGTPVFEEFPVQFVQGYVPLPSGNLNDKVGFDGPCLDYSVELILPEGSDAMPTWSQPLTNSGSMNLVVQAEFGGKLISGISNKLAAFVNGQLVGMASPQVVSGKELYFLTLANLAKGTITFKFYDGNHLFLHEKKKGPNFIPAASLGNFIAPFKVDFAPILVNVSPDANWTTTVLDDAWTGEQQTLFIAKDCTYNEKADSVEVVFLVKQCVTQIIELSAGTGLCLQADPDAPEVVWFMDGAEVGGGTFHGALEPGTYHYEALTTLGCPDLKSCPVVVFESGTAPSIPGGELPTQPPPACGQITLSEINVDNEPPTAICQSTTIFLDNNGEAPLAPADVDGGSFTSCGPGIISISQLSFDCQDLGTSSVILTVEDVTGKSSTCTTNVTVEDNISPVVLCKDITKSIKNNGTVGIQPPKVFESGSDNCGDVNFVNVTPNLFTCGDLGNNEVTLTVNDGHGNIGTCTAIVTIIDDSPPKVHCKKFDLYLDSNGQGNLAPTNVFKSFSDNCGQMNFVSVVPNAFDCSTYGTQPVTLTINDGHGNTDDCTTTIKVYDDIAPTAVCPASIPDVELNASGSGILGANIGDGSSTDNCSATETSPQTSFTCTDIGANTVTLTTDDGHGNTNSTSCSFNVVDNLDPTLACQDITISLDSNGNTTITPAQVYDAANSSDNCGNVNLVSISPNLFSCQQEGVNTVTLTANDSNGNTATCTATVTVNEFITNVIIVPTPETCSGAGDGSIDISATAGGGQVKYSIDGGTNFSASGVFNNLTPGTYSINIKVFGIPNICMVTGSTTVAAGGTAQEWHKDSDGDGYSDGITITSCTQPTGYILNPLAGTDCNDNDAAVNPGATEICDGLDNDCDGIIPTDELDSDGDGYMVCENDCNDSDAAINPGATEICNGIDDDCDGEIDEGVSGGLTWTGNVVMNSQAEVDDWSSCYSVIDGNLTIQNAGVDSLDALIYLLEVTGNVTVQYTSLDSLGGLDSLHTIGGTLTIYFNSSLTTLDGLDSLSAVDGSLVAFYNFALSDGCAIYDLINNGGVVGAISIFFNAAGCNSVADINSNCGSQNLVVNPNQSTVLEGEKLEHEKDLMSGQLKMKVFPNPATSSATLQFDKTISSGTVRVSDVTGKFVYETVLAKGTDRLEMGVSVWETGIYIIQVELEGWEPMTKRIVVMN